MMHRNVLTQGVKKVIVRKHQDHLTKNQNVRIQIVVIHHQEKINVLHRVMSGRNVHTTKENTNHFQEMKNVLADHLMKQDRKEILTEVREAMIADLLLEEI